MTGGTWIIYNGTSPLTGRTCSCDLEESTATGNLPRTMARRTGPSSRTSRSVTGLALHLMGKGYLLFTSRHRLIEIYRKLIA